MNLFTGKNISALLPSKKFAVFIALCVGVVLFFFIITSIFGSKASFFKKKSNAPVRAEGTVGDVISRDSNNNGIADWEESLWGLDPEGNGIENKKIVDEKKKMAGITTINDSGVPATQSDVFVRDLLSTILALNQSGTLTPEAVTNIALGLNKNIDAKRTTIPEYTITSLTIVPASAEAKRTYKKNIQALITKYDASGIGTEFEVLAQGLEKEDDSLSGLTPISQAYAGFTKDLLATPTPSDASLYALALINASNKASIALESASHLYSDVLVGMVGIDEFLEASTAFDRASVRFGDYFR